MAAAGVAGAGPGFAAPPNASLRPVLRSDDLFKRAVPDLDTILAAQKLKGSVSYAVADMATGKWLECVNETVGAPPASVTKAITALYALDVLGPWHRFETRLIATGGVVAGQVQGDLILAGGGDPTLDTDALAEMAAWLKAAGVISVKGAFKVYDGMLPRLRQIDPDQPDQVGYNPGLSGIALNFNRVHFEWKRGNAGYTVTMDARTKKYRPEVAMAVMSVRDRKTPIYTYADESGKDRWTVARSALGRGGARWLPVRKPAAYAGDVFRTLARSHGIQLKKAEIISEPADGEVIVTHQSETLLDMMRDMLQYSTNLTAEMVGMAATRKRTGRVTDLTASAQAMNRWAIYQLGMSAPALVDHSGLGDDSRLRALDLTRALVAVKDAGLRPILKPFLIRDENGRPLEEQPIDVAAKTGTLNFVSALAGYITARDGTEMAFAIFTADVPRREGIPRAERERPPGAVTWNRRAKRVQQALIERWDALYGA